MQNSDMRYAVYFAPERGSALARFGRRWLGYDAETGERQNQPELAEFSPERLDEITADPRHYGFHATLKPPFVLAEGMEDRALHRALVKFAEQHSAFTAPPLQLARIVGFWALVLSAPCPEMQRLADACVAEFDDFRAPPSEAELAKRRRAKLTPRQEALLARWGYPYVMQEFRFHMTLTGRLNDPEGTRMGETLAPIVAPLCRDPVRIDTISLFRQSAREAPFRIVERYRLAAPNSG